jgi:hypothetical protein
MEPVTNIMTEISGPKLTLGGDLQATAEAKFRTRLDRSVVLDLRAPLERRP